MLWRHEQLALRMVLATVEHHSHGAPRRQTTASRPRAEERATFSVTTGTQFFMLDDESVPVTGDRQAALLEPRPQGRVQRHTLEHIIDVLPYVQMLDVLVPQMGNQLVEVFRILDSQVPEQAIDVPKISQDRLQQRMVDRDLRPAQMAEQLVEMPEFVQFASLLQQQRAEQIIDIPVPQWSSRGWWRSLKFSSKTEFNSAVSADR